MRVLPPIGRDTLTITGTIIKNEGTSNTYIIYLVKHSKYTLFTSALAITSSYNSRLETINTALLLLSRRKEA